MRRIALVVLLAALAASCGGSAAPSSTAAGGEAPSVTPSAAPSESSAKPVKAVDPRKGGLEVGFGEFAITLEAKAIRPGPVTLVVHNGGKLVHGFEMKLEGEGGSNSGHGGGGDDEFKLEAPTFGPDDTIRIKATLPAGTYEIECYIANHDALGMRVLLQVRADAPFVKPQEAAPGEVEIQGFAFAPESTKVAAGTTVEWVNRDPTEHTVTATDGSFASKPLANGKGFRVTFDRAGSFAYACAIHPAMTGTVEVSS